MDPTAPAQAPKGERPAKGGPKGGGQRPPPEKGERPAPVGNKGKAKGKPKGKGGKADKGRGKGKTLRVPTVDMTAPSLREFFWDTLLGPVEAPSVGEAVAPTPLGPAVAPAPTARSSGSSWTELRRNRAGPMGPVARSVAAAVTLASCCPGSEGASTEVALPNSPVGFAFTECGVDWRCWLWLTALLCMCAFAICFSACLAGAGGFIAARRMIREHKSEDATAAETRRAEQEGNRQPPAPPAPPPPAPFVQPQPAQGPVAENGGERQPRNRDEGPPGPRRRRRGRSAQGSPPPERDESPPGFKVVYWTQSTSTDLRWHAKRDCRYLRDNARHRILPHEGCRGCTEEVRSPDWDAP